MYCEHYWLYIKCSTSNIFLYNFVWLEVSCFCAWAYDLLIMFRSIGSLLQLCLSIWSLLLSLAVSICNQILHYSELSLEVQRGHDYFRFVEGTCIIALCLSSLSLSLSPLSLSLSLFLSTAFSIWTSLQKLYSNCFWPVTSVGEKEEKANTIQPIPPSCVILTFIISTSVQDDLNLSWLTKPMVQTDIPILEKLKRDSEQDQKIKRLEKRTFWTEDDCGDFEKKYGWAKRRIKI